MMTTDLVPVRAQVDTQPEASRQIYKGYLIIPRYSRAWWWVTVLDPHGNELKGAAFTAAEGQPTYEGAVARAKQLLDRLT